VINWGCSRPNKDYSSCSDVINPFDRVLVAGNKLSTFQAISDYNIVNQDDGIQVNIPDFTTDPAVARDWVNAGFVVVCRNKLTAHSGDGIVVAAREEDIPEGCPLFVKYIKKKKEFRVHVFDGQVIDVQQKRRRSDYTEQPNFAVRNYHTGWVYCREGIEEPDQLRPQAIAAVEALGLDFGAVDIIYNQYANTCTVLEVNTAPGLEGTTVERYADAFIRLFWSNRHAT